MQIFGVAASGPVSECTMYGERAFSVECVLGCRGLGDKRLGFLDSGV